MAASRILIVVLVAAYFAGQTLAFAAEGCADVMRLLRTCWTVPKEFLEAQQGSRVGFGANLGHFLSLVLTLRLTVLKKFFLVSRPSFRNLPRKSSVAVLELYRRVKKLEPRSSPSGPVRGTAALALNERANREIFQILFDVRLMDCEAVVLARYPSVIISIARFLEFVGFPDFPRGQITPLDVSGFVEATERERFGSVLYESFWPRAALFLQRLPYRFRAWRRNFEAELFAPCSRVRIAFADSRANRRGEFDSTVKLILEMMVKRLLARLSSNER